jgi:hypothetical protein
MRTFLLISVLLIAFASLAKADEIEVSRFSTECLSNWQTKSFKRTTYYTLFKEGARTGVKAVSNNAASGLINKIHFAPQKYRYLRWSWKISHTIPGGNESTKAGDDYAARVYVIFPGRFFWQTKAINYIWANRLAKGSSTPNAFTANAMMIAVESGNSMAGEWLAEQRDLVADYRNLFGADPPEAEAIAIMTDTDNTGANAEAWYGEISLATEGK